MPTRRDRCPGMRLLAASLCASLLLSACGRGDDGPPAEPIGTDAAPTTSGVGADPSVGPPVRPIAAGEVADAESPGGGPPVVLTDVRLGAQPGFDRIVFEVAGEGEAGWWIGYQGDPRAQGSGNPPVGVPGEAVLSITLTNVALPGDAPPGVRPWSGPERQRLDEGTVLDTLVADTLFEGHYSFFAGLDRQRPFAVDRLDSPKLVVVDLLEAEPQTSVVLSQRCQSPLGFAIAYPEGWAVNSGETVPACTRFAPHPFRVPPGTDARVGAVTAWLQAAPFDRIASSEPPAVSRTYTTLDGQKAARIERVSAGKGLYPPGVRMTSYVVALEPGDDGPRTLVVDTVGLPPFDYARNVRVLDRMMETVEITRP